MNWLDSAGLPADGRGGGPGPRGTAQQPVTSGVSCCLCKWDHLLSPVAAMVRQNPLEGNKTNDGVVEFKTVWHPVGA